MIDLGFLGNECVALIRTSGCGGGGGGGSLVAVVMVCSERFFPNEMDFLCPGLHHFKISVGKHVDPSRKSGDPATKLPNRDTIFTVDKCHCSDGKTISTVHGNRHPGSSGVLHNRYHMHACFLILLFRHRNLPVIILSTFGNHLSPWRTQ